MRLPGGARALLGRVRPHRPRALAPREWRVELGLAALVLAAAAAGAALAPGGPPALVPLLCCLAAAIAAGATTLYTGGGCATAGMLGLAPALVLLPAGWVPAFAVAAAVAGALPGVLRRRTPAWRALSAIGDAGYAAGPALVVGAFGRSSVWVAAPALLAHCAADGTLAIAREWLGRGIRPRAQLGAMATVWSVDALLLPGAVALAVAGRTEPLAVVAVAPLCLLLQAVARERDVRVTDAAERVARLEREADRVDVALDRSGRTLDAGLGGLDPLDLALGIAVDALDADAGRARPAGSATAAEFAPVACPGAARAAALLAAERAALAGADEAVEAGAGWHAVARAVRRPGSAECLGTVSVCRADAPFTVRERGLLALLAAQAGAALDRGELAARAARPAGTPVGRTALLEALAAAGGSPAVLALALDDDDDALDATVAALARDRCRPGDVAGHCEDGTIVLILGATGVDGAERVAEDLRNAVCRLGVEATASAGVAACPAGAWAGAAELDAALRELDAARAAGGDRTLVAAHA